MRLISPTITTRLSTPATAMSPTNVSAPIAAFHQGGAADHDWRHTPCYRTAGRLVLCVGAADGVWGNIPAYGRRRSSSIAPDCRDCGVGWRRHRAAGVLWRDTSMRSGAHRLRPLRNRPDRTP